MGVLRSTRKRELSGLLQKKELGKQQSKQLMFSFDAFFLVINLSVVLVTYVWLVSVTEIPLISYSHPRLRINQK